MAEIRTAEEMREACIAVAQSFKVDGCSVIQFHTADRIEVTIRALTVAPREVPDIVREWCSLIDREDSDGTVDRELRAWLREEFGV